MARRKFKSSATSRGFRGIGQGLQSSRRELQEQARINIDALKLAKEQHKENTNIHIKGLTNAAEFEEGILREKQGLENKVRERKYEALSIKADRDVDRLKGEAEEKRKYAEHWAQLAPKAAAAAGKIAQGAYEFGSYLEAQKLQDLARENGAFDFQIEEIDVTQLKINRNVLNELKAENNLSVDVGNALYDSTFKKSSNNKFGLLALKGINENKEAEKAFVELIAQKAKVNITASNADEIYKFAAYEKLRLLGVNPNSKYGKQIIEKFLGWGRLKAQKLYDVHTAQNTEDALNKGTETVAGMKSQTGENEIKLMGQNFNGLVYKAQLGTYKDDRTGQITRTLNGLGEAFEITGVHMMETQARSFNDAQDVRDFFGRICTPGTGEDTKTCVTWLQRHPNRVEKIVDAYTAEINRLKRNENAGLDAEGVRLGSEVRGLINDFNTAEKDGENPFAEGTDARERLNHLLIEKINGSKASATVKSQLLTTTTLLSESASKHSDKYAFVNGILTDKGDNINDEDAKLISIARFNSLTKAERDALRPEFEFLQNVAGYTYRSSSGTVYNGQAAVQARSFKIVQDGEGAAGTGSSGRTLSPSGNLAAERFGQRVNEKANELIRLNPTKYGNNKNAAVEDAFVFVKAEYDKGAAKGAEYGEGEFARRPGILGPVGSTQKHMVYKEFELGGSEDLQLLKEELAAAKDGTYAAASRELRNKNIESFSPETVTNQLKFNINPEVDILTDPRFVSPHNVELLVKYANERKAMGPIDDPYFSDDPNYGKVTIPRDVHNNVKAYADFNNIPMDEAYNRLFKLWGHEKSRWPTSQATACQIQNQGKYVKEVNQPGYTAYNCAKAQHILPMTPAVREALKGKGVAQIFREDNGVNWVKKGRVYEISDPKKFYDAGGINVLIRDGIPANVLQTLGFIDSDVDIGDLPDAKALKTYLSPKQYRKLLEKKRFIDSRIPIPNDPTLPRLNLKGV
tara:strand:+ start:963 stop:3881 length:2919 start_codon:yes stop_codon:yes gene_type:complete